MVRFLAGLAFAVLLAAGCGDSVSGDPLAPDAGVGGPDGGPLVCSAEEVACDLDCCGSAEVCFAGQCVTPGEACRFEGDCAESEYCEASLGEPAAPPSDPMCVAPLASPGRCLTLPTTCAEGNDGSDGSCLPLCEYRPSAGPLDTVVKWQWGPVAAEEPEKTDVWATPTVGRVADANCDGELNELDPPNVVFVSGDAKESCCSCSQDQCRRGVLRAIDGRDGREIWSLSAAEAGSIGFAGLSVALGDVTGDGRPDIVAATGEARLAVISGDGAVLAVSTETMLNRAPDKGFGWGGGLALGDMDGDGTVEIAFESAVFRYEAGTVQRVFIDPNAAPTNQGFSTLSTFANVDADADLELVAGRRAYKKDGSYLWNRNDLTDGYPAIGDLDADGKPEVVLVTGGKLYVLEGASGQTEAGPYNLPGGVDGRGGPPTIADFDGDGRPEIGVAMDRFYSVVQLNSAGDGIDLVWKAENHDFSSSVTGSTVFDFEGDGVAEVVYNDECFLWVFDGKTGQVRFATPTTSFTATESSLVADVDGDGRADLLKIANGIDASASGSWKCDKAPWNQPDPATGRPAWEPPAGQTAYRGLTLIGDAANSWVGTRSLWNQHTYHVSNVCDGTSEVCPPGMPYGSIPRREVASWTLPWLNSFRQNVQGEGLFFAPDATVTLAASCGALVGLHATLRNLGQAVLPAGVEVGLYRAGDATPVAVVTSTRALGPGQTETLTFEDESLSSEVGYEARVHGDEATANFRECRPDNNASAVAHPTCID